MPKSEDCKRVTVSNWITALANNCITAQGEDAYCKMCDKQIARDRKLQMKQHRDTGVRRKNVTQRDKRTAITLNNDPKYEASSSRRKNNFALETSQ